MGVKFSLKLPEDHCVLAKLSQAFPVHAFGIVRFLPLEDNLLVEDIVVEGRLHERGEAENIVGTLAPAPVDVLHSSDRDMLLRVTSPLCALVAMFQSAGMVPVFPITARGELLSFHVLAPTYKVRELYVTLTRLGPGVTFSTAGPGLKPNRKSFFSPRQFEIYRFAKEAGYWDTPRRITLSDIASILGLSKSYVSGTLAAVERKIIKEDHRPMFS